ncbi:AraC family transcriptional regulator [Oribacterium sp. WCC10]|uniref:AraC family transcriptional regulator n=1 Tax=Oribacterium sp. WCC10 TaxID=1855343 RepID=UPI0008F30BEB|nr:helix-turn-helix transcriptional regulator [Oribacterium sp. WCC10]SFG38198.1 AraC-type DNA-binding protein [Oribacterium sp. WCC10]
MNLYDACRFLENLELIPVHILDSESAVSEFISKYRIHPAQLLFSKSEIDYLLTSLNDSEFLLYEDPFHIKFLFGKCMDTPVAYGPYCTELLSTEEITILLSHLKIRDLSAEDLARQRSRYTVKPLQNVHYHLNILFSEVTGDTAIRNVRTYAPSQSSVVMDEPSDKKELRTQLVREHYTNEKRLMDAVKKGDFTEALDAWHFLHKAVSYTKIGHTLETARVSAGITRTLIRIGAVNAGLPAEINDRISGTSSMNITKARSIDSIYAEHERLIREYCDTIKTYHDNKFSSTVQSLIYLLENDYHKSLTLDELASELNISSSTLIHQFKKETGTTPMAYLNHIRATKAADLLRQTDTSVQEVAASVGILDSNYFVKCFRKEYDMTPSAYRKKFGAS